MKATISKLFDVQFLLYVSLILALAASLNHVAYAFSTVNGGNLIEGYISAIAVDIGLLALAAGIKRWKAQGRNTRTLWGGIIFFSVISVYANWLAGIVHIQTLDATIGQTGQRLVALRPIVLSAVLPVLVIYLSEIVSGNHQQAVKEAAKEAKRQAKQEAKSGANDQMAQENDNSGASLDAANAARDDKIQERRDKVLELVQNDRTQAAIAAELGVSIRTVRRDIEALNGQLTKANGNGVKS